MPEEVIEITGTLTLDETSGLQNSTATPSLAGDADDNDVAVGSLPAIFAAALGSGVDAAAKSATLLTINPTSSVSSLSWTGPEGASLESADSGLRTLNDETVYLTVDPNNDNIVYGRTAGGTLVFAAYIEETTATDGDITGATIWMVTLEPIQHSDPTKTDEAQPLNANTLFVTASTDVEFDLSTLDSGQFQWNAFGNDEVQIIVTPDVPSGQTVNTSKGGGATTIGNSNQMLDGKSSKDADGEGITLTFVSGNPAILNDAGDYNYGDRSTIDYTGLQGATGGQWSIAQTQGSPSSTVTVTMDASTVGSAGTPVGDQPKITSVTIPGLSTFSAPTTPTDGVDYSGSRTVGKASYAYTIDFRADGTVIITGLVAKDAIGYTTNIEHNQLTLRNSGNDATSADWDIGGFKLFDTGSESVDVGGSLAIEDDAPRDTSSVVSRVVHEDALSTGNPDSGVTQVTQVTGSVTTLVNAGTDAPATWSLGTMGALPALTSQNEPLVYNVSGDTLTAATAGGRTVFTLRLEADGDYTFTLLDQLDHATTGEGAKLPIDLSSVLVATDEDDDSATPNAGSFVIEVENDAPTVTSQTVSGLVYEDALGGGNTESATPQVTEATGFLTSLVRVGADEDLVWGLRTDTSGLVALGLQSQGTPLTYAVNTTSGTLTASAGGRTVFTLSVGTDGSYDFDLLDQLDHTNLTDTGTLAIDLSSVLVATDFDRDAVTLGANKFVITVENDVPEIGPIADGDVEFVAGDFVTNTLNGAMGADDRTSGAVSYTFTSFTTPTTGIAGLTGQMSADKTEIVYFTDGAGGTAGQFDDGIDTKFFDVALDQATGAYTFTVHTAPPPAEIKFDLSTLDSGQFRWNAFGDNKFQVIVSSDNPGTQTTNTSKGGGATTIGNSNQMLDGVDPSKDTDGEAMVLTFVHDRGDILTQGGGIDYGSISSLTYSNLQDATGGQWTIAQTQGSPSSSVTATMKAYDSEDAAGAPTLDAGELVAIDSITLVGPGTIRDAGGNVVDLTFDADFVGTRTVGTGGKAKTYTFEVRFDESTGTVEIVGLLAKDSLKYTTDGEHNRLVLQNTGSDATSADWDIGGFTLIQSQPTPDQEFDFGVQIRDHDGDTDTDGFGVHVDGTGIHNDPLTTTADAFVF